MTVANSSCRPGRGAALAQSEAGILERFDYGIERVRPQVVMTAP